MLAIELNEVLALFNPEERKWESINQDVEKQLNATIPEDIGHVHTAFLIGGCQGCALKGALNTFGGAVKVAHWTMPPAPEEVEGQEDNLEPAAN